jgi:hypothetical protein
MWRARVWGTGAAQRLADLARLHLLQHRGEKLGQPLVRPPAEVAALERVRGVGIARRDPGEIAAPARLGERLLRLRARLLDALGARTLRHPHEDVRHVVLRALGICLELLEEQIDLAVVHLDLVLDFALAEPREQNLLAQVLAPGVERDVVALEGAAEIGQRHLVVLRDALDRAVELEVVDPDAGVARLLQLRLVEHQPLEDLPLEHRARRRRGSLAVQLALGGGDRGVQLGERDHFLVHHRHDAVDERRPLRRRERRQQKKQQQKHRRPAHVRIL